MGYNVVTKSKQGMTRLTKINKEEAHDMKKRILCLMLCLTLVLSIGSYALADSAAATDQVTTNEVTGPHFLVDGVAYADPGMAVYDGNTYVSMQTMVLALRPEAVITWEGEYAVATMDGLTVKARLGNQYIESNGRYFYAPTKVRSENNRLLVPVRVMAEAMGAVVAWNAGTGDVEIYSGCGAVLSGENYYNSNDLYWLSHIINAESGNQPLEGKLAVGTVILNRVASDRFPNSIEGVVTAPRQFTPYATGSIYREPNAESIIAAKLCMEGARVGGNSLYFVNPNTAPNSWASRNRPYVTTIGAHAFFA